MKLNSEGPFKLSKIHIIKPANDPKERNLERVSTFLIFSSVYFNHLEFSILYLEF